jgi:hypothetical protein
VLIEIQDRQQLLIHHDVTESVDALLRGRPLQAELRYRDAEGEIKKEKAIPNHLEEREGGLPMAATPSPSPAVFDGRDPVRILPYGIARNRLERATRRMHVPVHLVKNLGEAEVIVTTKGFYRKRPRLIVDAERRGLPIYVLRANTVAQMEACLSDVFDLESRSPDPLNQALREAEEAIRQVQAGVSEVELSPQNAYVRRRQHELAQAANLSSYSSGEGSERRVRVCRRG